jgi:hypothetical protein
MPLTPTFWANIYTKMNPQKLGIHAKLKHGELYYFLADGTLVTIFVQELAF